MKTWIEVSPYTGIEEDAPVNSVAGGGVDMNPTGGKRKLHAGVVARDGIKMDGRTKGYREHRAKLEASRAKRQEMLAKKNSSKFIEKVKESVIQQEYMSGVGRDAKPMAALNAAKSATGYEIYHKTFSGAMQQAYKFAKSKGYIVDPKEIDSKVATGPSKPSSGKTNSYILDTNKKQKVHIQVANLDNKKYELNMYFN
jgi:hypothetical protein